MWLAARMARLGRVIVEVIVLHFGREESLAAMRYLDAQARSLDRATQRLLFDTLVAQKAASVQARGGRTVFDTLPPGQLACRWDLAGSTGTRRDKDEPSRIARAFFARPTLTAGPRP